MIDIRLKAGMWVQALIRRCHAEAVPAMVVRRGDETAGIVLVKVSLLNGEAHVYAPARDGEGKRIWIEGVGPGPHQESDVDAYIQKQIAYDPDLWVIEIEDQKGRAFIDEPIEKYM